MGAGVCLPGLVCKVSVGRSGGACRALKVSRGSKHVGFPYTVMRSFRGRLQVVSQQPFQTALSTLPNGRRRAAGAV